MDAGWLALLIAVVILFVFFVLLQHWQRILRHQAWSVRRLAERVQNIETVADPQFLERLSEAAPMPLEQVFTLSFRLDDRFWNDALHATEDEKSFVREHGTFVGSVKLERWRSHTVATIAEILPDRKAVGWQTRSIDLYSDASNGNDSFTLWELPLARPGPSAERPPSLALLLRANSLEFSAHLAARSQNGAGNGHNGAAAQGDILFFRVPLDAGQLAAFRSHDPAANGNGDSGSPDLPGRAWHAFYSDRDESLGIEWQLRLHDLIKKSEWDRWKILESGPASLMPDRD